jgi:hypothetical protein
MSTALIRMERLEGRNRAGLDRFMISRDGDDGSEREVILAAINFGGGLNIAILFHHGSALRDYILD